MASNDKYDRQLRLWGAKGQRALGETQVVLVGASAAGTETLKNLVLPGVGSFCVVDDAIVTKQDVASNFFLTTVGQSRAEEAVSHLKELNPDVQGTHQTLPSLSGVSHWSSILHKDAANKKLLVVASDLEPKALEALSQVCTTEKIPLLVVQSYGLIGIVRLQLSGQVALLDPKPTTAHPDLRLKTSFPAFQAMAESIDMSSLENHLHGHVPYPIILFKTLQEWKLGHGGSVPGTFAEKQEFQNLVKSKSRDYNKELNFEEAVQNAYLAYAEQTVSIPEDLDEESTLGLLYAGLRKFLEQHSNRAPLNGSIPDMTSNTDWYVQLQGIYKEQAENDLAEMRALCPGVASDDVASFCANIFLVDSIQTRSLLEEFQQAPDEEMVDDWAMALMDPYEVPAHTALLWYLGVRACQVFFQEQHRYPGTVDDWESDIPKLQECWSRVTQHYRLQDQELVLHNAGDICRELTRYANAEIHNVASVVGGVASQEAVKIVTGQYTPLDNAYIFNGIVGVSGVYKF